MHSHSRVGSVFRLTGTPWASQQLPQEDRSPRWWSGLSTVTSCVAWKPGDLIIWHTDGYLENPFLL